MQWFINCLSGFVGWLCRIFGVTPKEIDREREKNPTTLRDR
jgi:hypothetical protein